MAELPAEADKRTWQSLLLASEANDLTLLDTWDPQPLAAIAGLVAQGTDDPQVFTLADGAFDFDGSADIQHVVLERPGNVFPKLVAVSFPTSLLDAGGNAVSGLLPPHAGTGGALGLLHGRAQPPEPRGWAVLPYGWDFLFHGFWKYLNYSGPDFTTEYNIGLELPGGPGRQGRGRGAADTPCQRQHQRGRLLKPDQIMLLLAEIKWFFTQQVDLADGKPTAANFQGGNGRIQLGYQPAGHGVGQYELGILPRCAARSVLLRRAAGVGHACVAAALAWAKANPDKHVRFYSQWNYDNYSQVLGGQKAVQSARLVVHPTNPHRSVALVPQAFWEPLVNDVARKDIKARGWAAIHALVPSTLLADALARSGF
ncbi:MAG: hypothetical protein WKG07_49005 [Hymenobacter sp.]